MATILVVDDLSPNREFLVSLLAGRGHRVVEAADGAQALALALLELPDLVITDVLMPVMDGYELLRRLHRDPRTARTPVLFYTASYGEREARAVAAAHNLPFVLSKHSEPDEMVAIVDRVLTGGPLPPETMAPVPDFSMSEQLRLLTNSTSRKVSELRIANARLRAKINIGLELSSQPDLGTRITRMCDSTRDLFGATYMTLGITDTADQRVSRFMGCGPGATGWIAVGDPVTGVLADVVARRQAVRGSNPGGSPVAIGLPAGHPEVLEHLFVPVASPSQVYGWIGLVRNEGPPFTEDDEHLVVALSAQLGRVYEVDHETHERRNAVAALRNSERLNRNLIEHLPHRILVKDRQSVILACNGNYARDLGLPREEIIGKDAFAFYSPELAEAYNADDQLVMSQGTMKNEEEPYEVDGVERWVHTVKVPYRDEQGDVVGVLVVFEDITERKRLEAQFHQSQKMEAIGRLAGGVAHDFNNLLAVMLGYCEFVLVDTPADSPRKQDIEEIQKAGMTAVALTRQLLSFSRMELIQLDLMDLNDIVAETQVMLARLIGEDIVVSLRLAEQLPYIHADRGQLAQVLMNLAVNARDAMPEGGILTIETATVMLDEEHAKSHLGVIPGRHVVLTVSDTGAGMTKATLGRLFEPFFTTKGVGKGTGLGLATVHGIVQRSGGTIDVYSEVGKGSSFKVYFPVAEDAITADVIRARPPQGSLGIGAHTVLVVEDSDALRELTRRLLERQGYTVITAASAEEAIQRFDHHPEIALLLTDVVMPGGSGPELASHLLKRRPGLKVVYMSGYTDEAIAHHGIIAPGIAFLHKPFSSEVLRQKLRDVLSQ
ncbi:MAG: response regulator [Gemmatimonadota bacterium]